MKLTIFTLLVVCTTLCWSAALKPRDRHNKPYKTVCYWGSWSFYRPREGSYSAEDLPYNLCTHINYGFAKLSSNKIALFDPDLDDGDENWDSGLTWGHGMLRRVDALRTYNPHMSHLISIGGWNEGSDKYSAMVSSASNRKVFVDSALAFLKKFDLDGLDLDWEYPGMKAAGDQDRTPGRAQDKQDYISLLKELREAFEPHGYLLTAAVSAGQPTIDQAYDIPSVNKYLDFINLMTYDFHGSWDTVTGHDAPLYSLPNATGQAKTFTVSYATNYWLEKGMDPKKIILGLPLYGRSFKLAGSDTKVGAKVSGAGSKGPLTEEAGMLGYNEICTQLKSGWTVQYDEVAQVPYAFKGDQWITYDDAKSIGKKLDFLVEKKLGGAMTWSIDTDDFKGLCHEPYGKYPLMKTISKRLNNIDGPDTHPSITHVTKAPHKNGDGGDDGDDGSKWDKGNNGEKGDDGKDGGKGKNGEDDGSWERWNNEGKKTTQKPAEFYAGGPTTKAVHQPHQKPKTDDDGDDGSDKGDDGDDGSKWDKGNNGEKGDDGEKGGDKDDGSWQKWEKEGQEKASTPAKHAPVTKAPVKPTH